MISREEVIKLVQTKYKFQDPSDIFYSKYSPIYIGTNENQRGVLSVLDVKNKRVLCSLGGGDFALNALALDALSVTVFDIDILAKLILFLKIAAIATFSNSADLKAFFTFGDDFFSRKVFDKIKIKLSSQYCDIWELIYQESEKLYGSNQGLYQSSFLQHELQQTEVFQSQYNVYYDDYYYHLLQKRLEQEEIEIIDSSIIDLPKINHTRVYETVYLSNILQYYQSIEGLNSLEKVHNFIENELKTLIKSGGEIGVCYGYYGYDLQEELKDIRTLLLREYPSIYEEAKFPAIIPKNEQDSLILTRK